MNPIESAVFPPNHRLAGSRKANMNPTIDPRTSTAQLSKWERVVALRDEVAGMVDDYPDGLKAALVSLNATIMRLCPHNESDHVRKEWRRYEEINRVEEWVSCPHCQAQVIVSRRIDRGLDY